MPSVHYGRTGSGRPVPGIPLPSRVRPSSTTANAPLIPALAAQVTADAKFVDLGADSLDTVRAVLCALHWFLQWTGLGHVVMHAWALTGCVLRADSLHRSRS